MYLVVHAGKMEEGTREKGIPPRIAPGVPPKFQRHRARRCPAICVQEMHDPMHTLLWKRTSGRSVKALLLGERHSGRHFGRQLERG